MDTASLRAIDDLQNATRNHSFFWYMILDITIYSPIAIPDSIKTNIFARNI